MRFRTLILRSLRFHWRGHLGVLLGAAVGSAALIGALVVGDSVRLSLRDLALQRLGNVQFAMDTGDRNFRSGLADLTNTALPERAGSPPGNFRVSLGTATLSVASTVSNRFVSMRTTNTVALGRAAFGSGGWFPFLTNHAVHASALLKLDATAATQGGQSRANRVQLFGVDPT